MNYDTPILRTLEPILTRFVRVYPDRATPLGMGLRLEFLGCEFKGRSKPHTHILNCVYTVFLFHNGMPFMCTCLYACKQASK